MNYRKLFSREVPFLISKRFHQLVSSKNSKHIEDEITHFISPTGSHTMRDALRRLKTNNIKFKTIIDVGASDGNWSIAAMEFFPQCNYYLIEARKEHEIKLKIVKDNYRNIDYKIAAAGHRLGKIYFDAENLFAGQASEIPYENNNIEVPVTTIDNEIAEQRLRSPFLLKLDTHGFEKEILSGSKNSLKDCSVLIIEAYNFKLTNNSFRFYELCSYLDSKGFYPFDVVDLMTREKYGAFWQMDIVFIKKDNEIYLDNKYA